MAKYTINFEVEGEVKHIENFIENNLENYSHIKIKNIEKKEISEIMEKTSYIYERNPDTGEIFRRRAMDYHNRECINPAVNSVPNL
tara:strand:- start:157 stop:414 length:258 start_codon:yes stop_codon:yes gene_type:complete